jgi:RNA polymerase sigma-70 factor, ECF subfamily
MGCLATWMPLPDSPLGLSQWLLPAAAEPAATASPSDVEREVIALFDQHRTRLLRYVLSIGLSIHDGEEVIQEVFLSLCRHLQQGRPRHNLTGWIFRVAHNLALRGRQGSQFRSPHVELDETLAGRCADPSPNPEELLLSNQRSQRLLGAVRALPERDQYCLHLRAEGLRYREIATVLGISLGAVAISLTRSLERLERADRG